MESLKTFLKLCSWFWSRSYACKYIWITHNFQVPVYPYSNFHWISDCLEHKSTSYILYLSFSFLPVPKQGNFTSRTWLNLYFLFGICLLMKETYKLLHLPPCWSRESKGFLSSTEGCSPAPEGSNENASHVNSHSKWQCFDRAYQSDWVYKQDTLYYKLRWGNSFSQKSSDFTDTYNFTWIWDSRWLNVKEHVNTRHSDQKAFSSLF